MKTFYCYFRGGGGCDVGAEAVGYTSIGGVEFDPKIAAACDVNFPHAPTTVADVRAVDPALLCHTAPSWFHASPSCKNASQAKTVGEDGVRETDVDIATAQATCRFIDHWRPPLVTIENVWQYRTFAAFEAIRDCLRENGYSFDYWHLNAADYGVPQTRTRLILVARQGLRYIQRPSPTHRQGGDMFHAPWVGWYEAAEGLPLQPGRLPTRLTRMLPEGARSLLINCKHTGLGRRDTDDRALLFRHIDDPAPTLLSSYGTKMLLAYTDADHQGFLTPAAFARLQSLPDSYVLPEKASLACTIIGNMVPPLLMQRVGEQGA